MAPLAHMPQWQIMTPLKTVQHAVTYHQEISLVLLKFQPEILVLKPINQVAPQDANSNMLQGAVAHLVVAVKNNYPHTCKCALNFQKTEILGYQRD